MELTGFECQNKEEAVKKAVIQIKYDEEKLEAIKRYMGRKQVVLEEELKETLQKLYEKHVPLAVREYIEGRADEERVEPRRKHVRNEGDREAREETRRMEETQPVEEE